MRKWTETVKPWPALAARHFYEAQVVNIRKTNKQIEVTVRLLQEPMLGRIVSFLLPLPIRPAGITADFLGACDIPVTSGAQIRPRETMGKKLLIQFNESTGAIMARSFKPYIDKES